MATFKIAALMLLGGLAAALGAAPLTPDQVPEPLKPWLPWVLHGHEGLDCPFAFNQADDRRCAWLTRLSLDLDERGGRFESQIRVYADGWAALPGDEAAWPQAVALDGKPAIVTPDQNHPRIRLPKGLHAVTGSFRWARLPEALTVPRETGLLRVRLEGAEVPFPAFNDQGQLWIRTGAAPRDAETARENRLEMEVFRRLIDEIPLQILTHMVLHVSGLPRELVLQGGALPGFVPLSLNSPLPARVEPDGSLRLQLRPGDWHLDLTARYPAQVDRLTLPAFPEPWPGRELWVFDARNALRMAQVEGVAAIDPRQTNLPEDWKELPAYQLANEDTFILRGLRRGDPEPEPDRLSLDRKLWLDFDGGGFTVSDTLSGKVTRNWRLDALDGMRLGRVSVDGQAQSITRLRENGPAGVEVRRGVLRLSADSRFETGVTRIPATGWATDFHQVRTALHLPPGWRLLAVTGVDHAPDTWVNRWTLLDLFVVLIVTLAAARLWNGPTALVTVLALSLLWHEPGAPRYVWLSLLIAIALLRVLPEGRFALGLRVFRNFCWVVLILIAIPFVYHQVRSGLYPQLDRPWFGVGEANVKPADSPAPASPEPVPTDSASYSEEASVAEVPAGDLVRRAGRSSSTSAQSKQAANYGEADPNAMTQTGPGLPRWRWNTVPLSWNGPVVMGQDIRLFLLSPGANLMVNLVRIVLLALLAALFSGYRGRPGGRPLLLLLSGILVLPPDARADYPSPALLEQLAQRLGEAPECLPGCAEIARLQLKVAPGELQQTLEIHALQRVIVPLPGQEDQWWPNRVLVDGAASEGLVRTRGGLSLALEPGHHRIVLGGPLPQREQIQLPLPLRPRQVEVESTGWTVEGVQQNGVPDSQLRLLRLTGGPSEVASRLEPRPLDAFLQVERTLRIGLDWRVSTTVRRLSPPDLPISLEIPLLAGEAVTTPGVQTRNGRLSVNLPPGEQISSWDSVLAKVPQIELRAPETTSWSETWRVDVSPLWHMDSEGLAVVHHQDVAGNWLPEWRPWPGEEVTLSFVRPGGAPGNTLTIDDSRLALKPGLRATDVTLSLTVRSAQGAQHTITLPEDAILQAVSIDGTAQPIRQQQRSVTVPLHPGSQAFALSWRTEAGVGRHFRAPPVDLGAASVNSSVQMELGHDRWVLLTGGPEWGPAVLYWGLLIVVAALAVLLGRVGRTPLKTGAWLLLLIGLSQIEIAGALVVVAWLLALGQRGRLDPAIDDNRFNLIQLGLGVLTSAALLILVHAVEQGLLGYPEMQVAGGGSNAYSLQWYQDRSGPELPRPWVISVPLWLYRVAMLAWALWLAHSLLRWLFWGWGNFAAHGPWRKWQRKESPPGRAGERKADPWRDSPAK